MDPTETLACFNKVAAGRRRGERRGAGIAEAGHLRDLLDRLAGGLNALPRQLDQKRGVFGIIKRELRRRSAIEPVIGHLKSEGHLGRCYLKGRPGDAANVILSAVGYNFRRLLAWLRAFLTFILSTLTAAMSGQLPLRSAS